MLVKAKIELEPDVLYAIQWEGKSDHCLNEMLDLFTDAQYLRSYLKENIELVRFSGRPLERVVRDLVNGTIELVELLYEKAYEESTGTYSLNNIFEDLGGNRAQFRFQPKKLKGTSPFRELRIYAIKDGYDKYVLSGYAIKLSQEMNQHPSTALELEKLKILDQYLKNKQDD